MPTAYARKSACDGYYHICPPTDMSLDETLAAFERDFLRSVQRAANDPFASTRWEGERFQGRDLVVCPSGSQQNYAVLEFNKEERVFYVRDSCRSILTRDAVKNILEN